MKVIVHADKRAEVHEVQKPEAVRAAYIDEVKEGEAVKRIARVEGRKIVQAVLVKES